MTSGSVEYSRLGAVAMVQGGSGLVLKTPRKESKAKALAREVMKTLGPVLLATGSETLSLEQIEQRPGSQTFLKFTESIRGIPVHMGFVAVQVAEPSGRIVVVTAMFLPDRSLPRTPALDVAETKRRVIEAYENTGTARVGSVNASGEASLIYFGTLPDSTRGQLTWSMRVNYEGASEGCGGSDLVWADANDGVVALRYSDVTYTQNPCPGSLDERDPNCVYASMPDSDRAELAKPRLCGGRHFVEWSTEPGTSYVGALASPNYGWKFARNFGGGPYSGCYVQVTEPTLVRIQAHGSCGSSDWTPPGLLDVTPACD